MSPSDDLDCQPLLDALREPALLLDRQATALGLNAALCAELGRPGCNPIEFTPRPLEQLDTLLDHTLIELLQRTPLDRPLLLTGVTVWRKDQQGGILIDLSVDPFLDGSGRTLIRMSRCEETGILLRKARRTDRLACLGKLTAGVAHDLNNQLSAAMNIAALMLEDRDGPQDQRSLEILIGAAKEAADLVHRLMRFAGAGEESIATLSVRDLIEHAILLVRHDLPPDARMRLDLADSAGDITGDTVLLIQVVVHLLLIGTAASGDSGMIQVVARSLESSAAEGEAVDPDPPPRVLIEVRHPFPDDVIPGEEELLKTSRRIVRHHGGTLERIEAEDGISHRLVLLAETSDGKCPVLEDGNSTSGQRERSQAGKSHTRVLVVDDDPMVRDVALAMLKRLDCEPLAVSSGKEALRVLEDPHQEVDLILLDLVMKDQDGASTLREIRRVRPDMRVVISSGFGIPDGNQPIDGLPINGSLEKPYSLATLRKALESALR